MKKKNVWIALFAMPAIAVPHKPSYVSCFMVFVQDTFDFSQFGVRHMPQGGVPDIYVDICVEFQVNFELPVGTWFLVVRCAEIEVIVIGFWGECARVYLWTFEYLFVDCKVHL